MNDTYIVNDLQMYAQSIRKNAALSFSETYNENLDDFITIPQVCNLIDSCAIGTDEEDHYIIDEDSYNITFDKIRTWIYNAGLSKLAAEDKIESAWDDENNEIIFWVKDSQVEYKTANNGVDHESNSSRKRKSNKSSKRKNT